MSRSEELRSAAAAAIGGGGGGGGVGGRSGATNWAELSVRVTDPTLSPSGYTLYKITVTDRAASRAVQCVWRRFKECEEVFQVMCRAQAEAMAAGSACGAGRLQSPGGASSRTPSVVSSACTRGSEQLLQQPSPAAAAAHATPLYAQFARTFAKKAFSRFSEETIEKRRKGIEAFAKYVIAASSGDGDAEAAAATAALDGAAVSGPVCLKQENYFADPALPGAATGDDDAEELHSAANVSEGEGGGGSDDRSRHRRHDHHDDDEDDDDDEDGGCDDYGEEDEDAPLPAVLADTRAFIRLLGMAPRGAGYMSKMGKTTMGIRGAFKLRWFELHPAERPRELAYMRRPSSEVRKGAIPLSGGVSIVDQQSNRYPHSFCIMGAHLPRTYLLLAPSEAAKRDWVQLLSEVVAENNARHPPTTTTTTAAASSSATSAGGGYAAAGAAAARSVLGAPRKGFKALWGRVTETPQPAKGGGQASAGEEEGGRGRSGVRLQDYSLLCIVGIGSFGKVLKVAKKDEEDVRRVYAMKVIEKDLVVRNKMVFHTISEKEVLEKATHPFIVRLHRSFQTRKQLVLVMDFLSGGELFFHLQREKRFDEERARVYSAEIALALSHLHGMDIIYRDLKSENLVLDSEGHLVLTDFGLAKVDMPRDGRAYTFCGTPEYMAPELVRKDGHTFSVDFWSLGILLYEMAAGSPPFFAKTLPEMYHAILHQPLQMPAHFSSDLGDLLRALIERDPAARLSSASAMQKHVFYDGLSFSDVLQKKVPVPWLPAMADEDDTKYFSTEFTTQVLLPPSPALWLRRRSSHTHHSPHTAFDRASAQSPRRGELHRRGIRRFRAGSGVDRLYSLDLASPPPPPQPYGSPSPFPRTPPHSVLLLTKQRCLCFFFSPLSLAPFSDPPPPCSLPLPPSPGQNTVSSRCFSPSPSPISVFSEQGKNTNAHN